ncbi:hypothetical protein RFI_24033 [Reticulomyxa filosa]|uniref:Uncharacterized protein n=1 Tax=Reticulomyxa filosa TaxID=46433 RepID=X6MH57_RETFI|nr:hypothetical protein RFI_24033 [Reticulomyxa filosa]|eukprot:ETO13343.1 hypothetical protein RFI_24033 [Reticulomyxa filosa]
MIKEDSLLSSKWRIVDGIFETCCLIYALCLVIIHFVLLFVRFRKHKMKLIQMNARKARQQKKVIPYKCYWLSLTSFHNYMDPCTLGSPRRTLSMHNKAHHAKIICISMTDVITFGCLLSTVVFFITPIAFRMPVALTHCNAWSTSGFLSYHYSKFFLFSQWLLRLYLCFKGIFMEAYTYM